MKIKFMTFIAWLLNKFRVAFVYGFTGTCEKCNSRIHIKYLFGKCIRSGGVTNTIRLNKACSCPNCKTVILLIQLSKLNKQEFYTYIQ
jgi:hypothetical protein